VTDRTEQTARRTDIWVLWTPEGRERQQVKEGEQEDIEFFCWCVLGEEGMWGLLGLWVRVYRKREQGGGGFGSGTCGHQISSLGTHPCEKSPEL
jgi:hypothetical protein